MKKLLILTFVAAAALAAMAQARGTTRGGAHGAGGGAMQAKGKQAKVVIDAVSSPRNCLCFPPSLGANGTLMAPLNRKYKWAVLEMKYKTFARWMDELTVTWHVLAQVSKQEQNKNAADLKRGEIDELPPEFSYYTATTRFQNLPEGDHMAGACLPAMFVERFGEPVVVTAVIMNKEGDTLVSRTESTITLPVKKGDNWWESETIMESRDKKTGRALVERRSGLLDRSKTPFALVNPADYEFVAQ